MNFDEYQVRARQTAVYRNLGNNITYPTLGLCGEAGEVVLGRNRCYELYPSSGGEEEQQDQDSRRLLPSGRGNQEDPYRGIGQQSVYLIWRIVCWI